MALPRIRPITVDALALAIVPPCTMGPRDRKCARTAAVALAPPAPAPVAPLLGVPFEGLSADEGGEPPARRRRAGALPLVLITFFRAQRKRALTLL